jgi:hypothetical protein
VQEARGDLFALGGSNPLYVLVDPVCDGRDRGLPQGSTSGLNGFVREIKPHVGGSLHVGSIPTRSTECSVRNSRQRTLRGRHKSNNARYGMRPSGVIGSLVQPVKVPDAGVPPSDGRPGIGGTWPKGMGSPAFVSLA